jgi:hypothetical protein
MIGAHGGSVEAFAPGSGGTILRVILPITAPPDAGT